MTKGRFLMPRCFGSIGVKYVGSCAQVEALELNMWTHFSPHSPCMVSSVSNWNYTVYIVYMGYIYIACWRAEWHFECFFSPFSFLPYTNLFPQWFNFLCIYRYSLPQSCNRFIKISINFSKSSWTSNNLFFLVFVLFRILHLNVSALECGLCCWSHDCLFLRLAFWSLAPLLSLIFIMIWF